MMDAPGRPALAMRPRPLKLLVKVGFRSYVSRCEKDGPHIWYTALDGLLMLGRTYEDI